MVTMRNIRRVGNVISMDCYAEGKEEGYFYLEINAITFEIITNTFGVMNAYIFQALQKVKEYVRAGETLPEYAISMWC